MSAADPKLIERAWLIVGLLWVVACLNYLDRIMITTMRGSIVAAIPMSDAQFGLLTSVFLWVYGSLSPFAGFLADRFSRSRVIILSLLVWSAITWMTAHATTFNQLLATRALMGISEAFYLPAALALIADYHRGTTRSLATGIHMSGIMLGSGLGGIGGWLAEGHGWSYVFNLFGIFGIVYAVFLILFIRDVPPEKNATTQLPEPAPRVHFFEALSSLFSHKGFIIALAYWGLLGLVGWAIAGWMPTYLTEHFNLTQGVGGLSATVYLQAAAVFGVLIGGAWADRWSRTNERGRILVPVLGLCIAAPGILLAANTTLLAVAIGGLILYGLMRSFSDSNMMPILCLVSDPRYRATGYGLLNMCACYVGGLTIYIGGAMRDNKVDLHKVFDVAAISLLGCAALLYLIKPARVTPTAGNNLPTKLN